MNDRVGTPTGPRRAGTLRTGDVIRLESGLAEVREVHVAPHSNYELARQIADANAFAIVPMTILTAMFTPVDPVLTASCAWLLGNAAFATVALRAREPRPVRVRTERRRFMPHLVESSDRSLIK